MKNSEYWKLRFAQLEEAQNGKAQIAFSEIEQQYKQAQKQLEGQIAVWYQRFADNNEISLAEARKFLKTSDLKEFKWDVQDYIKYGKENAVNGQWVKQLENASAKFHISKLEALKIQTQQSLEVMFQKQFGTVNNTMQDIFKSGYFHTAYELQKGFNIGFDIDGLSQSEIEKVISKPWAVDGYNFSERIWNNKAKLISKVHNELTQNIMLGADPQKAINNISKKMNTSKSDAGRLVMTEEAYFSSLSQKECFEELGVEEYEIVATLDSHTSKICQELDGKVFPIKEYQAGVTAPPFHVRCRSTTAPYFSENFGQIGERAARDEETGKTYYIPDDMNYQKWKKAFVGGDKSGFDVKDKDSILHYKHTEQTPTPKKEYLTKKKLELEAQKLTVQQQFDELESKKNISYKNQLNDIESELLKVQSDLQKAEKNGIINTVNNPFSQDAYGQRKIDAVKNRFTNDVDADAYYRAQLDRDFLGLEDRKKYATWEYTHNSNPVNKPLSGYTDTFDRSNFKGWGNVPWNRENQWRSIPSVFSKYGYNGHVVYESVISELTKAIEKTTFDQDVIVVRGSSIEGLAGLAETAGLKFNSVARMLKSQNINLLKATLEELEIRNHAFTSTAMVNVPHAFRGDVYYEIYMPKGTKALYAEPQSYYGCTINGMAELYTGQKANGIGDEAEILIQRGTKFKITEIDIKSDAHSGYSNIYTVKMEVVEQPNYFTSGYEHTFDEGLTSEK